MTSELNQDKKEESKQLEVRYFKQVSARLNMNLQDAIRELSASIRSTIDKS